MMPFIARKNGKTVIPEDVGDGEDVYCPDCNETMRARGPFEDGRARHFYHIHDVGGSCHNGDPDGPAGPAESETHQKLKSFVVSGLRQLFNDGYTRCGPEITLDVSQTMTAADQRRADVLLEFTEPNRFYGEGLIVEVQHLNASKNIRETTHDYLQLGYSVYWATIDDFDDGRFLMEEMEAAFNEGADAAFAAYRSSPPALDTPERLLSSNDNSPYTTTDPVPECDHELVKGEEAHRVCVRCGLKVEYCFYDEDRGFLRRVANSTGGIDGEKVWAGDRRSVEQPVTVRQIEEKGNPPDHDHNWGFGSRIYGGEAFRCSQCASRMVVSPDKIVIRHENSDPWQWYPDGGDDCDHEWEDLGFIKVCTECRKSVRPWEE